MIWRVDPLEHLKYPIGRAPASVGSLDATARAAAIDTLAAAPGIFRSLVTGLSDAQLATPYRPGGWTIRQVVHHVPDSHINAYVRMKLALTEDLPPAKTYDEAAWAELPEAKTAPIGMSLALLDALHERWVAALRPLPNAAFSRAFAHPEWGRVTIDDALATYAWHCRHHAAHIRNTRF